MPSEKVRDWFKVGRDDLYAACFIVLISIVVAVGVDLYRDHAEIGRDDYIAVREMYRVNPFPLGWLLVTTEIEYAMSDGYITVNEFRCIQQNAVRVTRWNNMKSVRDATVDAILDRKCGSQSK